MPKRGIYYVFLGMAKETCKDCYIANSLNYDVRHFLKFIKVLSL